MTRALALAFGLALLLPLPALPQSAAASPFLPQGHWSYDALRRLALEGSVPGPVVTGRRTLSRDEVVRALRDAAEAAGDDDASAAGALARFLEEFPTADPARAGTATAHVAAVFGGVRRTGRLGTGTGAESTGSLGPPVPLTDIAGGVVLAGLTARSGRRVAAFVEGGYTGGDRALSSAHVAVALGPLVLWGGRRPVGFGPGHGGGIVLGDRSSVDGGGFQLARPSSAPGVLRFLGPIHFETLLARAGPTGQVEDPWFWAARGSVTPHPRLTLGINRGALFGGEGNVDGTLKDLLFILIGKHAGGGSAFENQIVAVDVHYRPPLPIPAELYVEWGLEDSSGAFYRVPGVVWGGALSGLPGLGTTRVGLEHADFARSCCGNPPWYRHMFLLAGWTEDSVPLGHPLAGHGREWLLYGTRGLVRERLQLRASVAVRDRWGENLYAPDRAGSSRAANLEAVYLHRRWVLSAATALETGEDWTETSLRATVRYSP